MRKPVSAGFLALAIIAGVTPLSMTIAAQRSSPEEIIQREGQFVFTDGASFFVFRKDNTFESGPVSELSGQTTQDEAISVVVRVGDDYFTEQVHR